MATGGCFVFGRQVAAHWRTPAARRAARRWAAASAEGAIARLTRELAGFRAEAAAMGTPGVVLRLAAAAPALADLCCGRPVAPAARLRRNVALHAAGLPRPDAPAVEWRRAQRGPRLGGSIAVAKLDADMTQNAKDREEATNIRNKELAMFTHGTTPTPYFYDRFWEVCF